MDSDQLGSKAKELWDTIVRLETEKYDLEERQKRQDYDVSIPYIIGLNLSEFEKIGLKCSNWSKLVQIILDFFQLVLNLHHLAINFLNLSKLV